MFQEKKKSTTGETPIGRNNGCTKWARHQPSVDLNHAFQCGDRMLSAFAAIWAFNPIRIGLGSRINFRLASRIQQENTRQLCHSSVLLCPRSLKRPTRTGVLCQESPSSSPIVPKTGVVNHLKQVGLGLGSQFAASQALHPGLGAASAAAAPDAEVSEVWFLASAS